MKTHFKHRHNFSCPVMDDDTEDMYILLYGLKGTDYCDVLSKPPYEIAVISRLLAYLDFKKHCKHLGLPTDFFKNTDRSTMEGYDFGHDFSHDSYDDFDDGTGHEPFDDEPFDIEKFLAKSDIDLFDDEDDDEYGPLDFDKIFGKTNIESSVPVDYADCDNDSNNNSDIKRGEASDGCDENC